MVDASSDRHGYAWMELLGILARLDKKKHRGRVTSSC